MKLYGERNKKLRFAQALDNGELDEVKKHIESAAFGQSVNGLLEYAEFKRTPLMIACNNNPDAVAVVAYLLAQPGILVNQQNLTYDN